MISKEDQKIIIKMKKSFNQKRIDDLIEECLGLDEYYFRCQIVEKYGDMS